MTYIHQNLAKTGWFQLSISEQLANVGSEFSRAFQAKKNGKPERFTPALERMLELLNLTLMDPRWPLGRKREVARLKENILTHLCSDPPNLDAISALDRYFYYFGVTRQIENSIKI